MDRWVEARKKKLKKAKGSRSKKEIEEEITELRAEARKLISRATDVEIISTRPPPHERLSIEAEPSFTGFVSLCVVCAIVWAMSCRQAPIRGQRVLLVAVPGLFSD